MQPRLIAMACLFALSIPYLAWAEATSTVTNTVNQAAHPVQHETELPLTLQQAYQLALQRNLRIRAIKAQIPEASADIVNAKLRPNPAFMTDLGFFAEKTYRVGGLVNTFESPGRRKYRTRLAEDQYQETQANSAQAIHEVLSQVRQTYNAWITAIARAQFQKDNMQVLQILSDLAVKSHKKADVKSLDVDQTHMLVLQAQSDALQAAADIEQARLKLVTLLNTNEFTAPTVTGFDKLEAAPLPDANTLVARAFENRKDLQANTAAIQAEKDRLRLYRRSRVPNLNLALGYDIVQSPPKFVNGLFTMGQVSLPIFDRQQGNIAKAKATGHRLALERQALKQQIFSDINANYQKALTQQSQWQRFHQEILPLTSTVDTEAQHNYEQGNIEINDALGTHANVLAVRLEAIQSFINYQQSLSDLQTALNTGLNGMGNEPVGGDPDTAGGDNAAGASGGN